MGRGIRKIISLFENLTSILDEADRRIVEEEENFYSTEGAELTQNAEDIQRARDRTFTAYKLLLRLVPQLKSVIQDPELTVLNTFLSNLQEGANGARSDDIKRIKEELANMVNSDYDPNLPLKPKTRDGRGLQHDICGQLLAPIEFDWNNDEVRAKIRNNEDGYTLGGHYFITCLYPKGRANPELVERGFLRSRLLLQVYCSIFTSPSSSEGFDDENDDGPTRKKHKSGRQMNATKSHVASLLNMDGKVTGRSIAYAAVMVGLLLLVIYSLQVGYSLYLTYRMRRSGSKYIAVSAMSVSTTSLSTTSKRKTMPPRSSELKNFLHGGIIRSFLTMPLRP